jgi:hypothetical protein
MRECTCNAPIPVVGHVAHARGCPADNVRPLRGLRRLRFDADAGSDEMSRRAGPALPVGALSLAERAELVRIAEAIERGWTERCARKAAHA